MLRRNLIVGAAVLALIVIPFFAFGDAMETAARQFLARPQGHWTAGVAIAALLASDVALPVPSSFTSTAAGSLLGFAAGTVASWVGMTAGCLIGYWLGRAAGGRWLQPQERERMERAYARFGFWTVLLMRPVPVLAEASVLYAGLLRLPLGRYLGTCAAANLAISGAYGYLGAFLGGQWR